MVDGDLHLCSALYFGALNDGELGVGNGDDDDDSDDGGGGGGGGGKW